MSNKNRLLITLLSIIIYLVLGMFIPYIKLNIIKSIIYIFFAIFFSISMYNIYALLNLKYIGKRKES